MCDVCTLLVAASHTQLSPHPYPQSTARAVWENKLQLHVALEVEKLRGEAKDKQITALERDALAHTAQGAAAAGGGSGGAGAPAAAAPTAVAAAASAAADVKSAVGTIAEHCLGSSTSTPTTQGVLVAAIASDLGREQRILFLRLVARAFAKKAKAYDAMMSDLASTSTKGGGGAGRSAGWAKQIAATLAFVMFCLGGASLDSQALENVKVDLPEYISVDGGDVDDGETAAAQQISPKKRSYPGGVATPSPKEPSRWTSAGVNEVSDAAAQLRAAITLPAAVLALVQTVVNGSGYSAHAALLSLVQSVAEGRVLDAAICQRYDSVVEAVDFLFALIKTSKQFSVGEWDGIDRLWTLITTSLGIPAKWGGRLISVERIRTLVNKQLHHYTNRLSVLNLGDDGGASVIVEGEVDADDELTRLQNGVASLFLDDLRLEDRRKVHVVFLRKHGKLYAKIGLDNAHLTITSDTKMTSFWVVPMSSFKMATSVTTTSTIGVMNVKDVYDHIRNHFAKIFLQIEHLELYGLNIETLNQAVQEELPDSCVLEKVQKDGSRRDVVEVEHFLTLDMVAMAAILGRPNAGDDDFPVPTHAGLKRRTQRVFWRDFRDNKLPELLYFPPTFTAENIEKAPKSKGPSLWRGGTARVMWDILHQLGSTDRSNIGKVIVKLFDAHNVWSGESGAEAHLRERFHFDMKARLMDTGDWKISAKQGAFIDLIARKKLQARVTASVVGLAPSAAAGAGAESSQSSTGPAQDSPRSRATEPAPRWALFDFDAAEAVPYDLQCIMIQYIELFETPRHLVFETATVEESELEAHFYSVREYHALQYYVLLNMNVNIDADIEQCSFVLPSTCYKTDSTPRDLKEMLKTDMPFRRFNGEVFEACQLYTRVAWYQSTLAAFQSLGLQPTRPQGQRVTQIMEKMMILKRTMRLLTKKLDRKRTLAAKERKEARTRAAPAATAAAADASAENAQRKQQSDGAEDYFSILSARVDMAKDSRAAEKRLERERDRVQHEQDVEKERGDGVSKCELKCDESGFGDLLAVLVCSPGTKQSDIVGIVTTALGEIEQEEGEEEDDDEMEEEEGRSRWNASDVVGVKIPPCTKELSAMLYSSSGGRLEVRVEETASADASSSKSVPAAGLRIHGDMISAINLSALPSDTRRGRSASKGDEIAVLTIDLRTNPITIAKPKRQWGKKSDGSTPDWSQPSVSRIVFVGLRQGLQQLKELLRVVDDDDNEKEINTQGHSGDLVNAPPLAFTSRVAMVAKSRVDACGSPLALKAGAALTLFRRRCDAVAESWHSWVRGEHIVVRTCGHCSRPVFAMAWGKEWGFWHLLPDLRDDAKEEEEESESDEGKDATELLLGAELHVECLSVPRAASSSASSSASRAASSSASRAASKAERKELMRRKSQLDAALYDRVASNQRAAEMADEDAMEAALEEEEVDKQNGKRRKRPKRGGGDGDGWKECYRDSTHPAYKGHTCGTCRNALRLRLQAKSLRIFQMTTRTSYTDEQGKVLLALRDEFEREIRPRIKKAGNKGMQKLEELTNFLNKFERAVRRAYGEDAVSDDGSESDDEEGAGGEMGGGAMGGGAMGGGAMEGGAMEGGTMGGDAVEGERSGGDDDDIDFDLT